MCEVSGNKKLKEKQKVDEEGGKEHKKEKQRRMFLLLELTSYFQSVSLHWKAKTSMSFLSKFKK